MCLLKYLNFLKIGISFMKLYINVFLSYHELNQLHNIEIILNILTLKPSSACKSLYTHQGIWGDWTCQSKNNFYYLICSWVIYEKLKTKKSKLLHRTRVDEYWAKNNWTLYFL